MSLVCSEKATVTNTLIYDSSFCPITHRLAARNAMVNDWNLRKEVSIMKRSVTSNDLNNKINRHIQKKLYRQFLDLIISLSREPHSFPRQRFISHHFLGCFGFPTHYVISSVLMVFNCSNVTSFLLAYSWSTSRIGSVGMKKTGFISSSVMIATMFP